MGSTHRLRGCLAKMFNQNLLVRKQTNPESRTFFKTGLDHPKSQYHEKGGGDAGRNVLDKNELKRHENQMQYMVLYWILKLEGGQGTKKTF